MRTPSPPRHERPTAPTRATKSARPRTAHHRRAGRAAEDRAGDAPGPRGLDLSVPHKDSKAGHWARMDRPFRDAVEAAGLDPGLVTPHVMRHTAITKLVQAGVDLPTVQRVSGHKTHSFAE